MPKATQEYNLYVLKPNLVKEWHPTKNAELGPYDVTPGSGKRVWWICREGHEWKATVKVRIKGEGCPFCDERMVKTLQLQSVNSISRLSFIRGSTSMSGTETLDTIFGADFRKFKRFRHNATVRLEIPSSEHLFYAQMNDFSHDGMCVETSTNIRPGTNIDCKIR